MHQRHIASTEVTLIIHKQEKYCFVVVEDFINKKYYEKQQLFTSSVIYFINPKTWYYLSDNAPDDSAYAPGDHDGAFENDILGIDADSMKFQIQVKFAKLEKLYCNSCFSFSGKSTKKSNNFQYMYVLTLRRRRVDVLRQKH